jgi:hypothetical protein
MVLDAALALKVQAVGESEGCPGHFDGLGRASASASYAKQFGVEAPSWPPQGARS